MSVYLLEDSLKIDVYYDPQDCKFDDNVCVAMFESCPDEERILQAAEVNIYLTEDQARQLAAELLKAADASNKTQKNR